MRRLNPDYVAKMPWVTRLVKPKECQGFKANTPLKAIYRMGNKPPVGLSKYRCKNPARWKFQALRSGPRLFRTKSGVYCWAHLLSRCLFANPLEEERTIEFLQKEERERRRRQTL